MGAVLDTGGEAVEGHEAGGTVGQAADEARVNVQGSGIVVTGAREVTPGALLVAQTLELGAL